VYDVATGFAPVTRPIVFTVQGNIGSATAGLDTYALDTGEWPPGTQLTLIIPAISDNSGSPANGIVAGKGGGGGGWSGVSSSGGDGSNGIRVNVNIDIINRGIIGGGGGGSSGSPGEPQYGPLHTYKGGSGAGITITNNNSYRYGGAGCPYANTNPGGNLGQPGVAPYTNSCGWRNGYNLTSGVAGIAIGNAGLWTCNVINEEGGSIQGAVRGLVNVN
jgi:hypothetical protein